MHHLLAQIALLAGQPLLIRGEAGVMHTARMLGLMRRALSAEGATALFNESANAAKPWETREQPVIIGSTAIIPVTGTLCSGLDPITAWWMDCQRYEAIQKAVADLGARSDIRTVVFDISSPGGYVQGVAETAALIARHLEGKLTIAWSGSENCSCAYWLSTACQKIIATPSATLANVGVCVVVRDYSKMFEAAGVSVKVFKSGAYKGAGAAGTSLTPEQEEFIQERVDSLAAEFVSTVKAARPAVKDADMQGQWFSGSVAVEKNFADATALTFADLLEEIQAATRVA